MSSLHKFKITLDIRIKYKKNYNNEIETIVKYFSEPPKKQFPGQSGCAVNKAAMTGPTVATSGLAGL